MDAEFDARLFPPDFPGLRERLSERLLDLYDRIDNPDGRALARTYAAQVLDDVMTQAEPRDDGKSIRWAAGGDAIEYLDVAGNVTTRQTLDEVAAIAFPKAYATEPAHLYGRWEDAMLEQMRLLDFARSYDGRRVLDEQERDMNARHKPEARLPAGFLVNMQLLTLSEAEPCWIAPDVVDLIHHARETWTPEAVIGSDAFVPSGFCLLSKPIYLHNEPDNPQAFRALAWTSIIGDDNTSGCFWISVYGHVDDDPNPMEDEMRDWWRRNSPLQLAHYYQWTWGTLPSEDDDLNVNAEPYDDSPGEVVRRAREQETTMQVLWRLSQQLVPVAHKAPRGIRRDAKRRLKLDQQNVNVIKLRRERSTGDSEETDRHYNVSFLVHGYWAVRHTKNGPRQVWVRPHVKGQGPFKDTKRAWEFIR
jgi:hypothetical protein